ncbi:MAG: c-type cytochrome [Polyangiaceae bacterium]
MKKIALRVLGGLVALVLAGVVLLVVKFFLLSPSFRPAPEVKAPSTPEAIARGKYLVDHVAGCLGCHSPVQDDNPGDLVGPGRAGAGRDFGQWKARRSSAQREPHARQGPRHRRVDRRRGPPVPCASGVSAVTRALFPQMPYLTYRETLSDDDALAIIGYLRTLAPIDNDPGKTVVNFPVSMFIVGVTPAHQRPPPAPPSDKLARGRWLLKVASCNDCHDAVNERMEKIPASVGRWLQAPAR